MTTKTAPPLAFLGVCDRASRTPLFQTFSQLNIIALRDLVLAPFLPATLEGVQLVFAMYAPAVADGFRITLRDPKLRQVGEIRAQAQIREPQEYVAQPTKEQRTYTAMHPGAWITDAIEISSEPPWLFTEVGVHTFYVEEPGLEPPMPIGSINIGVMQPEPLSDAKVAAIRSDPHAMKSVRARFECNQCKDSISSYVGLEHSRRLEDEGFTWYSDLPDAFSCSCGGLSFSLEMLRNNMHILLGRRENIVSLGVVPLYEALTIQGIYSDLIELLDVDPSEETLQQYIAANLVALHTIAPADKIFIKAAILTRYKTDFAILTPSRELVLVEIEKAGTRLMKSDGGVASPLQHAFDQVNDWLHAVNEHRAAVLDGLGLKSEQVTRIRGVVVAGRDRAYDPDHLRKLKAREFGPVRLLTYDDLAANLQALASEVRRV
jgi:Domain of unknown function (DUF4263)